MNQQVKTYERSIRMQMEDWLHDPVTRDERSRKRLLGLAAAVAGVRATLNNKCEKSKEYQAIVKLVCDFSEVETEEGGVLAYFATLCRDSTDLEELSIDILTDELSEADFIQFLDRLLEIHEMDGLFCEKDAAHFEEMYRIIDRCIQKAAHLSPEERSDYLKAVRIFVDSILDDVDVRGEDRIGGFRLVGRVEVQRSEETASDYHSNLSYSEFDVNPKTRRMA